MAQEPHASLAPLSFLGHFLGPEHKNARFRPSENTTGKLTSGTAGPLGCTTTLAGLTSLKVTASRIKWKHSPEFDPLPVIDDEFLKSAFINPELLRMPREAWPATRHADRTELIALARMLDQHQALAVFEESEASPLAIFQETRR